MTRTRADRLRYVDALCAVFPHYARHLATRYPEASPTRRREIAVRSTCPRMDAPQYRPDLDLCIESERGDLAAICTIWLDEVNCVGTIEPMGVHPDHRRRGLARCIMLEGMRRARVLGVLRVETTSYSGPAHRTYKSVGLEPAESISLWTARTGAAGA